MDSNHGIEFANNGGESLTVNISNTHIHDLVTGRSSMSAISVEGNTTPGGFTEVELTNITINNVEAPSADTNVGIVFTAFDGVGHDMNITISNITITSLSGPQSVAGVTAVAVAATADASMNVDARNITINNLTGSQSLTGGSSGLIVVGAEASDSFSAITTASVSNLLLSENFEDGSSNNCNILDLTPLFMGTGNPELSITSNGGNLTDDTSCSSYFTQPTDQNNLTNLASTLGTLGDYGGYVPTIPLFEGSPAIDAGVTIAGLNTDARGVSRPLGLAYDSGAYESPFTKTVEGTETLASTGQNIKLVSFFATLLLTLGLMLQLRRHYV